MPEDPNARRRAQSFWKKVKSYIAEQVGKLSEIMEVTEVRDDGRITVRTFDPDSDVTRDLPRARGLRIEVGDRVIVTSVGGHPIVTSVMRGAGGDVDDGIPFGADGTSEFAARADHQHLGNTSSGIVLGQDSPQGTGISPLAIGRGAYAHQHSVALGNSAVSGDQEKHHITTIAIGYTASATGQVATALGRGTNASGDYSVANGLYAEATGDDSIAIGRAARATATRSIAIGNGAASEHAYVAVIQGTQLRLRRNDGVTSVSSLVLDDENGTPTVINLRSDGRLSVAGVWHAPGNVMAMFPPNRKVGSSPAPLKSYPNDNAGGLVMQAGEGIFVYGSQTSGYIPCVSYRYGIGYVKYSLTVAN